MNVIKTIKPMAAVTVPSTESGDAMRSLLNTRTDVIGLWVMNFQPYGDVLCLHISVLSERDPRNTEVQRKDSHDGCYISLCLRGTKVVFSHLNWIWQIKARPRQQKGLFR